MLTKLQFQTLFGFKPKRRLSAKKSASKSGKKVVKKSASKSGKKVVKKSNKVGTRMVKGVKRTIYKGKNGGKFYKKASGRKVYFGPALTGFVKTIAANNAIKVMASKAVQGAGYTLGYKAANAGVSMVKKIIKKNKKTVAMGTKKLVAGKKRTVYKTPTGAKYYKSSKGNKVYFGHASTGAHKQSYDKMKKKHGKKKAKDKHNSTYHSKLIKTPVYEMKADPDAFFGRRKRRFRRAPRRSRKSKKSGNSAAHRHPQDPRVKAGIRRVMDGLDKHTHDYANVDHSHAVAEPVIVDVDPDMMDPDMMDPVIAEFGKKRRRRSNRFGNHGSYDLSSMMGPSRVMFASSIPRGL